MNKQERKFREKPWITKELQVSIKIKTLIAFQKCPCANAGESVIYPMYHSIGANDRSGKSLGISW